MTNLDPAVVESFGEEWSKFDQSSAAPEELQKIFELYFKIFPWNSLPAAAQGFDLGCGTGRWANFVAPKVGTLHCIDASDKALEVAKRNLAGHPNCEFHHTSVDALPLADSSMDFGYSLGVLHHVPDTQAGISKCVQKLKPGAPFLLYLYYAFDNRPWWFRQVWKASDGVRRLLSSMPFAIRAPLCEAIAIGVYWPLARTAKAAEKLGVNVASFPLSAYRDRTLYVMRTDALDRFGTKLEQRFTRKQIQAMMEAAGLERISFSDSPYWCAVGHRSF
jgi:SAM-dependent methyltransferase